MSTLKVTALKNPSSSANNIVLNANRCSSPAANGTMIVFSSILNSTANWRTLVRSVRSDQNNTPQTWNATTLDSPNITSSITYKIAMANQGGTDTFYLNSTVNASTTYNAYERGSSELIVMKINV